MKKCAVFSCMGLGDGLISLVLSNNLYLNGAEVTTFHPFLKALQGWFPHLSIQPFPAVEELAQFDAFFIFYEKSKSMQAILEHCIKHYPEQTLILNPIATENRDYPYWEVGRFEGRRTLIDNLVSFCKQRLHLRQVSSQNGIVIPKGVAAQRHPRRVILHPTSSRPGKDWPQDKFIRLSKVLEAEGYDPLFILHKEERSAWEEAQIHAPVFADLSMLAQSVCESGYMIGNDSGIGHLASCLGIPTLTVCRNKKTARFWRPAWVKGVVIAPYLWIPNIKGIRLRDKHWKRWISVRRVFKGFRRLVKGAV